MLLGLEGQRLATLRYNFERVINFRKLIRWKPNVDNRTQDLDDCPVRTIRLFGHYICSFDLMVAIDV